jgi:hypothetical protein
LVAAKSWKSEFGKQFEPQANKKHPMTIWLHDVKSHFAKTKRRKKRRKKRNKKKENTVIS